MDYPLNMIKPGKGLHESSTGFAVANDVDEHKALGDQGYEPKLEAPEPKAKK